MKGHVRKNTSRLRLFVFLLLSTGSHCDYEETMLDRLTESCPYLSTCSRTANQKFKESSRRFTPCCRQCSCDEGCHRIENCCPEVSDNSTSVSENIARKHGECISTAYPDQGGNGYSTSAMFYAVTSCPEDYPNNRIAQQCADTQPEDIQQVTFASDKEGAVYKNIYCAQCHNAPGPNRWQIGATCDLFNGSTDFQLDLSNIVHRGCVLSSQPPENSASVLEKRCFRPDIAGCNVTGSWDVFDPVTERACSTETVPFIRRNNVYKNVFCFYCNNAKNIRHATHSCLNLSVFPVKELTTLPFWALFDPSLIIQSKAPTPRDLKGCKFNEIYDSNTNVCRELHCPPGEVVNNGKCQQAFLQTDGFNMKLFFKIQPQEPLLHTPNPDDLNKIIYTAIGHVTKGMKKKRCKICFLSALRCNSAQDAYFLREVIQTSATCPFAFVLATAESVNNTSLTIDLAGNDTNFAVEHVMANMDESYMSRTVLIAPRLTFRYDSDCRPDGVPAIDFLCPYVEISGLDYVTALREGKLRQTHHYATYNMSGQTDNELANITFRICVDEYLPRSIAVGLFVDSYVVMAGCLILLSTPILSVLLSCFQTMSENLLSNYKS